MSVTRLTGMATGMDTDTTVKQLMKPYQMRVDKLTQNKQLVQWKQDAYRDIMSDLNSFKSNYFEKSNTDMTTEMSQIISRQNNFQSCAQVLKIFDRISEISANQVGKIG